MRSHHSLPFFSNSCAAPALAKPLSLFGEMCVCARIIFVDYGICHVTCFSFKSDKINSNQLKSIHLWCFTSCNFITFKTFFSTPIWKFLFHIRTSNIIIDVINHDCLFLSKDWSGTDGVWFVHHISLKEQYLNSRLSLPQSKWSWYSLLGVNISYVISDMMMDPFLSPDKRAHPHDRGLSSFSTVSPCSLYISNGINTRKQKCCLSFLLSLLTSPPPLSVRHRRALAVCGLGWPRGPAVAAPWRHQPCYHRCETG